MPRHRTLRTLATRLSAAFLAVCVLVGVLRSGDRYFYCPMMHAVMDAPCCAGDRTSSRADEADDDAEVRAPDCCEEHRFATVPLGAVASASAPVSAPVLAVLARPWALPHPSPLLAGARFEHEDRAGPAATARHRAELMVFLN